MEINTIPFSKLYKLELSNLGKNMIEIIERHDPETLLIEEVFDLLRAEKPNIDALKARYGPHPITAELKNVRKQMYMYAAAICYKMNFIVRDDSVEKNEDVRIAKNAIDSYLPRLSSSKNQLLASEKIDKLNMEIEKNPTLELAFDRLGFTNQLDELMSKNSTFKELYKQRLKSISERPKVKTLVLKKSIINAMKDMLLQIKVAELKNTTLDYLPLINELNDLLQVYRNQINMRDGYNKRKAEEKNGESTDQTPTNHQTQSAGRMFHLNAEEEVEMNGMDTELVENEKAAASSSKPMQLPLDN